MATRTISNAGGNYNATGTWVEGVVPTSADDVVSTATSGQLTVNVTSAALSINLSNYNNTVTVNAAWTISGTGSHNLGTGTWSGPSLPTATARIIFSGSCTLTGTTASRPVWNIDFTNTNSTKTLASDIYVRDVAVVPTSAGTTLTLAGNFVLYVSGNFASQFVTTRTSSGSELGRININNTKIVLNGSGFISTPRLYGTIEIDSTSTVGYTTRANGLNLGPNGSTGVTFSIISGSISNQMQVFLCKTSGQSQTDVFNLNITRPLNLILDYGAAQGAILGTYSINGTTLNLNKFHSLPNVTRSVTTSGAGSVVVRPEVLITGCGLSASELIFVPVISYLTTTNVNHTYVNRSNGFRLNSDFEHKVGKISGEGGFPESLIAGATSTVVPFLRSLTASQVATLNIASASAINDVSVLDINCNGSRLYTLGSGTVSNSTNVFGRFIDPPPGSGFGFTQ